MTLNLRQPSCLFFTIPKDGTNYGSCASGKLYKKIMSLIGLPACAYKYSRLITSIIIQFPNTFENYTISPLQLLIEVSKRVQDD